MEARYGASALAAARLDEFLLAVSLKDYEDLGISLWRDAPKRNALRRAQNARLAAAPLFDGKRYARRFGAALAAAYEAFATRPAARHVVAVERGVRDGAFALGDADAGADRPLLVHVGGARRTEGWVVVDVAPGDHVDLRAPMHSLPFDDSSVAALYASHVLEHASERGSPLEATLREWHRVLAPRGALLVAVPDLAAVARLLANDALAADDRANLHRVVYGGQTSANDYHHVGFAYDLLARTLEAAGFCEIERVAAFGLFEDTSLLAFQGTPLSLNARAVACGKAGAAVTVAIPATPWTAPDSGSRFERRAAARAE
jgi:predicted SAM-dependent methyltransferase